MQKLFILFFTIIFLTNCSSGNNMPYQVRSQFAQASEYSSTCQHLSQKMTSLNYQKMELKNNDKFRLRYMLIIPAIIETFKQHSLAGKIDKEIEKTKQLVTSNQCNSFSSRQKPNYSRARQHMQNNYQAYNNMNSYNNHSDSYYSYYPNNGYQQPQPNQPQYNMQNNAPAAPPMPVDNYSYNVANNNSPMDIPTQYLDQVKNYNSNYGNDDSFNDFGTEYRGYSARSMQQKFNFLDQDQGPFGN